jgi:hypothetical protein
VVPSSGSWTLIKYNKHCAKYLWLASRKDKCLNPAFVWAFASHFSSNELPVTSRHSQP